MRTAWTLWRRQWTTEQAHGCADMFARTGATRSKQRGVRAVNVTTLVEHYGRDQPTLSRNSLEQYRVAARRLDAWAGYPVTLHDLTTRGLIAEYMRSVVAQGMSRRTANGRRTAFLTLWRWALRAGLTDVAVPSIPRFREPKRTPTAWTLEELRRLLDSCDAAAAVTDSWTSQHWRGLVLTIYDTSLRLGCLLSVRRDALTSDGWLHVPAELQKQHADTRHRLHADTAATLHGLPQARLLFPWPLHRRAIWQRFRSILHDSGLPSTRRDLFHRLRRTSYTQVFDALGPRAASEHAGHSTDLSRAYYDPTLRDRVAAADVIPRP